nr:PRD domain-containing protein [Falsibacillus albus]
MKKVLNNNAVVVIDGNEEKIAFGPGIAFQKKKHDIINRQKVEKLFVMEEKERFQQLLLQIPEEHLDVSEQIISHAEESLGTKLNEHIHIALTDHLSFAIERAREGIHLQNKLLHEIKILYKKEFEIGRWAIEYVHHQLGIEMRMDEAAYIALHIHTAKPHSRDIHETVKSTTMISDMVAIIKEYFGISLEEQGIAYQRLLTHLRFSLTRVSAKEFHTMDPEMLDMIKKKFSLSYKCAKRVGKVLSRDYEIHISEEELGYITLHIERLQKTEIG